MSISTVDLELKRAFTEMQVNRIETTKKINMIDTQMDLYKTSKKKYDITGKEIMSLNPDTRVYSTVGRMFVLSNVSGTCEELRNKENKCEDMLTQLEEKKDFLIKRLKEQEGNLRDMVQQKKDADIK